MSFCRSVSNSEPVVGLWLFAVPLLHFLNGDCEPYRSVTAKETHNDISGRWWGIQTLNYMTENAKQSTLK